MEYFRTFLNEIEFSREFLMMMMMMRKIEKFLHRFFSGIYGAFVPKPRAVCFFSPCSSEAESRLQVQGPEWNF